MDGASLRKFIMPVLFFIRISEHFVKYNEVQVDSDVNGFCTSQCNMKSGNMKLLQFVFVLPLTTFKSI